MFDIKERQLHQGSFFEKKWKCYLINFWQYYFFLTQP
ncbi:hypothetical protein ZWY2020_025259 [Hordeum vulgare]|nr:hypothetical protein ZWY2020_025259 [Hordeum vulgare]